LEDVSKLLTLTGQRKLGRVEQNIDQAQITQGLNSIFQPAIEWDINTYEWNNLSLLKDSQYQLK